jgi:putative hydrolase of the HAD superfamily
MFEDMASNLVPAHALGMTTVHVVPSAAWTRIAMPAKHDTADHIHHATEDLPDFLSTLEIATRP